MKKILPTLMVGTLAVTLLIPSASFAETTASKEITKGKGGYQFHQKIIKERGVNQEQLIDIVQKYAPELVDEFQSIENNIKNSRQFPQLDEATKEKLNEIREKVKAGTLTQEQAKEEMEALGIKAPMGKGPRMELDEATKEKLAEIKEKVKAGTLTQEQAKEEMEALGIKAPVNKMDKRNKSNDDLRSKLQQAVQANDEAQVKSLLNELLDKLQNKINE